MNCVGGTWDAGVEKMSFVFQMLQGLLVKYVVSDRWHFLFSFWFVEVELGCLCLLWSLSSLFKPTLETANRVIHLKEFKII